jgi:hypothetical protein
MMRGSVRESNREAEVEARDDTGQAASIEMDDAAVQVLPRAMEIGTSLSPVPQNPIALPLPLGPPAAAAAPLTAQQQAPVTLPAPTTQMAAASQLMLSTPAAAATPQPAAVSRAVAAPPSDDQSNTVLLRAMFLTLAGALTLATAIRLIVG